MDAKKAKTFFHWASQFRQLQHGKSYCVILHILVRAGLLIDSRELLESAIRKKSEAGNPSCLIVEMLLSIHEAVLPGPQAFDLFAQAYSKMRMVELAFDACRCLGDHGFNPNLMSVNTLLHVAQKSNENELARKAFEYMIERIVSNSWKRCAPGVIADAALVYWMFEEGRDEEGMVLLKRMLQKNMVFDNVLNASIIFAYCRMGKLE
ncbi:pentatricopeptide repeat-containing protein At1g66345, mitochondrial-like [Phoenix dactylifera]|uniref:Pentatricopeptide repeat-containing protein At1g66345, mitochondrial-like n=1 Tax=Phoenix dactylifera TaxID=42345 RepID=A0A8B8J2Y1_PHODC|nr:pentatricopeptide repeat-containing protein At1g66345, mitochondrial-like [Phoenix dactylifera]